MKQPEDNMTAELALNIKRGRGRPALDNALTPAERAKRYRDNKRASGTTAPTIKRDASQQPTPEQYRAAIDEFQNFRAQVEHLQTQLALAEAERNTAHMVNAELIATNEDLRARTERLNKENNDLSNENSSLLTEVLKWRDASQKTSTKKASKTV